LFNNKVLPWDLYVNNIVNNFKEYHKQPHVKVARILNPLPVTEILVKRCFDGVAQGGICGAGFLIKLNSSRFYRGWMGGGYSINTKVELMGLWILLSMVSMLDLDSLQVFGDSQVIINLDVGKVNLRNIVHQQWRQRI